jgi:hypothetical protein
MGNENLIRFKGLVNHSDIIGNFPTLFAIQTLHFQPPKSQKCNYSGVSRDVFLAARTNFAHKIPKTLEITNFCICLFDISAKQCSCLRNRSLFWPKYFPYKSRKQARKTCLKLQKTPNELTTTTITTITTISSVI